MNLTIRLSVKEALPKRMHTIRFHLYEILKQENLGMLEKSPEWCLPLE